MLSGTLVIATWGSSCLGGGSPSDDPSDHPGENRERCDEDGGWSPTVEASEITLTPGGNGPERIETQRIAGLRIWRPDPDHVDMDVGRAELSRDPDWQLDSYPPIWHWSECISLDVEIPVKVAENAEPGRYTYGVTVYNGGRESIRSEFAIRVSES